MKGEIPCRMACDEFSEIGEMLPGGFLVCRGSQIEKLVCCNHHMAELFGCADQTELREYLNSSYEGMPMGADYTSVSDMIRAQLISADYLHHLSGLECQIRRKDGGARTLAGRAKLVQHETLGELLIVLAEDVTENKAREERESSRQFSETLQILGREYDSVYKVDLDKDIGIAYRLNGKAVEKADELHPHVYSELMRWCIENIVVRGGDEMQILLHIPDLIALLEKKETVTFRYQARANDSQELNFYEIKIVKAENFSQSHTVIMAFFDAQEKVKQEEQLAEHKVNEVLRTVAEDYICLIDVDLQTERETQYMLAEDERRLPGWTLNTDYSAAIRDYAHSFIVEEDRERFLQATRLEVLEQFFRNQPEFRIEYDVVLKGKRRHFQGRFVRSSRDSEERHIFIGIRDVTEETKKRVQEERLLQDALQAAEAASKAKTTFLFNMSHDIRTPMNAISGFADRLEKNLDHPEKMKDYIRKIRSSCDFLLSLINNVLQMARIENGKLELDEHICDAQKFWDTIYTVFATQMKEKELRFDMDCRICTPFIYCDVVKMREVFLNLLSNAMKYTPSGGLVTLRVSEEASGEQGIRIYKVVVADTGIGMSADYIPVIFEAFSRERTTTESFIQGTGLGMAIVKNYIELMRGSIEVDSHVGEGTVFTVTLPLRVAEEVTAEKEVRQAPRPELFKGRRILLAEDNELNAEIAQEVLQEAGFEVDWVADGVLCVSRYEQTPAGWYDLILMDIQMPNMNGYKATELIRAMEDKKKAAIPIIAMTANAFEEDRQDAFRAGMNEHLSKPINVPVMLSILSDMLQKN